MYYDILNLAIKLMKIKLNPIINNEKTMIARFGLVWVNLDKHYSLKSCKPSKEFYFSSHSKDENYFIYSKCWAKILSIFYEFWCWYFTIGIPMLLVGIGMFSKRDIVEVISGWVTSVFSFMRLSLSVLPYRNRNVYISSFVEPPWLPSSRMPWSPVTMTTVF